MISHIDFFWKYIYFHKIFPVSSSISIMLFPGFLVTLNLEINLGTTDPLVFSLLSHEYGIYVPIYLGLHLFFSTKFCGFKWTGLAHSLLEAFLYCLNIILKYWFIFDCIRPWLPHSGWIVIAAHRLFVVAQGLLSVSTCGTQAAESASSLVVGRGLSCPEACGILWLPWWYSG